MAGRVVTWTPATTPISSEKGAIPALSDDSMMARRSCSCRALHIVPASGCRPSRPRSRPAGRVPGRRPSFHGPQALESPTVCTVPSAAAWFRFRRRRVRLYVGAAPVASPPSLSDRLSRLDEVDVWDSTFSCNPTCVWHSLLRPVPTGRSITRVWPYGRCSLDCGTHHLKKSEQLP